MSGYRRTPQWVLDKATPAKPRDVVCDSCGRRVLLIRWLGMAVKLDGDALFPSEPMPEKPWQLYAGEWSPLYAPERFDRNSKRELRGTHACRTAVSCAV